MSEWRVGSKVPINVYDGDRPVCQCHTVIDAKRILVRSIRKRNSSQCCRPCIQNLLGSQPI